MEKYKHLRMWNKSLLVITALFLLSTSSCKKKANKDVAFAQKIELPAKKGSSKTFIEYSAPDNIDNPDAHFILKLNQYSKSSKNAKTLYLDDRGPAGIVAFMIQEDSFHETDIDKDGVPEIHFIYLVQKEELKPVEVNVITVVGDKDLMIKGQKTIDEGAHTAVAYFKRNFDQDFNNYPRAIRDYSMKLFDQFVAANGSKEPFIDTKTLSKNQYQETKGNKSQLSADFLEFQQVFPDLTLPYELKEDEINKQKVINLGQKMIEQFICNPAGSEFDCVVSPVDSETKEGIDLRNSFKALGKVHRKDYSMLVYKLDIENYPEIFLATYDNVGKLISRIHFSGSDSDTETFHGKIRKNVITTFETEYDYGHKGNPDHFQWQIEKVYNVRETGKLVEKNDREVVGDRM